MMTRVQANNAFDIWVGRRRCGREQGAAISAESEVARRRNRMSRTAWRTPALLSSQGGLSVLRGREERGVHCTHSFRRSWRVACAQKFRCFFGQRGLQLAFTALATQLFFRKLAYIGFLTKRVAIPPAYSTWDGASSINVQ